MKLNVFPVVLLVIVAIGAVCLTNGCKRSTGGDEAISTEARWLRDHAVDIRTTDPGDTGFDDLMPLKQAIGDARVVLLGEASHGDGTTFYAKTRLIKFLHREMGFDVLVFESSFYECHKAWLELTAGTSGLDAAGQAIFWIWSNCVEMEPLFRYLAETSGSSFPLELAGVDCQFSGSYGKQYFLEDLEAFLEQQGALMLQDKDWPAFKDLLSRLIRYEDEPDAETLEFFFNFLDRLRVEVAAFSGASSPLLRSPAFWREMLATIRVQAEKHWSEIDDDWKARLNLRDARMAKNFLWLYRNRYKDRKIIVWAAIMHVFRNPEEIDLLAGDTFTFEGLRPMGHILWEELEQAAYVVGFTASGGFVRSMMGGANMIVWPAPVGSLDYFMAEAGFEYGFVNFRDLSGGGEWLRQPLVSRPVANGDAKADWPRIMDGIFYMRTLEASTMRE